MRKFAQTQWSVVAAGLMIAILLLSGSLIARQGRGGGPGGGGIGGGQGGGNPGGGEDEGLGNNLSVPVVFAEGYGVLGLPTSVDTGLRPRPEEPTSALTEYFDPNAIYIKDGVSYYPQQTTSHWRAAWRNGATEGETAVVNWSDNITRQKWTARSTIRVETVLYQSRPDTMNGWTMAYLLGKGPSELWGASGSIYASTYRTVYSVTARLKIQKISGPGGTLVPGIQSFDDAVYKNFGTDGPGGYSAEVNVSGNLIYGYNWTLSRWPLSTEQKLGWWRLTFTLDPTAAYTITPNPPFEVGRNVQFSAVDPGDLEDEAIFNPTLVDPHTSVLEIEIVANRKGGKRPANPGGGER